MKEKIEIYEEHGGVLYSKLGKAEMTFFAHQISVKESEIAINPNVVKFNATSEERALFSEYAKPVTAKLLFNKSKSVIHELAFSDESPEYKAELLKDLRTEINSVLKKM